MARREDMAWRDSPHYKSRKLLWVVDDLGSWRWSGYVLRQLNSGDWAVAKGSMEISRFTSRTDARLYAELRAEVDREKLTTC